MASHVVTDEATEDVRESWLLSPTVSNSGVDTVVMRVSGVKTPLPSRWLCDSEHVEARAVEFLSGRKLGGAWEDAI